MIKFPKARKVYKTKDLVLKETGQEVPVVIDRNEPGYRSDNKWHLYDPKFISDLDENCTEADAEKWENTCFMDKSYWGYYCWPEEVKVNLNQRSNFNDKEKGKYFEAAKAIEENFTDPEFIKSFIRFSTIEEAKGNEKFDKKKFHLFKGVFRNFGNSEIVNELFENLATLVKDSADETRECSQKLAAEMTAGLIRGSKYWPLKSLKSIWAKLKNVFDLIMENISIETLEIWLDCFSTSFVIKIEIKNFF